MRIAFYYSIKMWLTSLLVAPFIYLAAFSFEYGNRAESIEELIYQNVGIYIFFLFLSVIFSFCSWLFFLLAVDIIIRNCTPRPKMKFIISIIGVLLTVGTSAIFLPVAFRYGGGALPIMLSYCICIAIVPWFYPLKN